MHLRAPPAVTIVPFACLLQLLLLLSVTLAALAKSHDYIDLLERPDHDDFVWARDQPRLNHDHDHDHQHRKHNHTVQRRQAGEPQLPENKEYGACRTPLGVAGHCRHMVYCRLPELKEDVWKLVAHLCIIESSTIGICCPAHFGPRLAPQIVSEADDDLRVVNQPEQRGCGITTREFPRIVGGRPAEPDEWPWMVAILRPGVPYVWCGGVLVTDRHILTAAHCVHKFAKDELVVRLGEYNIRVANETRARDFRIANVVVHLDYDPLTFENDIALLRIDRAALFNSYIWPVCMPPFGESWQGREAVVIGWGAQTFSGPHSDILMEVALPIWRLEDCKRSVVEHVGETMMCAGMPAGGHDSCQGDSGGPLLIQLPNRRWITVGIVSWGVRCGEPNRPGMYTRVDRYLHWIIDNSDI